MKMKKINEIFGSYLFIYYNLYLNNKQYFSINNTRILIKSNKDYIMKYNIKLNNILI